MDKRIDQQVLSVGTGFYELDRPLATRQLEVTLPLLPF
jgi:hypothetical protein